MSSHNNVPKLLYYVHFMGQVKNRVYHLLGVYYKSDRKQKILWLVNN